MNSEGEFSDLSFVLVRLLKEPIYSEDKDDWNLACLNQDRIRRYFNQIGQDLVLDQSEGFAFLQQIERLDCDRVPRLNVRRSLNYQTTLLLVCLREEFCRFDTNSPEESRLVKTRVELQNLVSAFLPESTNRVRDKGRVDSAIAKLRELGFLRLVSEDPETFEVRRIVKAKIGAAELEDIKKRLSEYEAGNDSD
jgi:hypothetical protein